MLLNNQIRNLESLKRTCPVPQDWRIEHTLSGGTEPHPMKINSNFKFSLLVVIILVYTISSNKNALIAFDVFGYYLYLPAITHLNDIKLCDYEKVKEIYRNHTNESIVYQIYQSPKSPGNVIRYPIGAAITYAPAYFFAMAVTTLLGKDHEYGF